ncbi:tmcB-like protein [Carpediemonas membranifera]|uniref:TmcB-like protein n=1 Tax=Carpediemonas membranifera TaxID=201153 RepID=A0A8J6E2Z5_9EUKA|nr:tmcB-like protein [Carpediemonas membranifera]|eukprot:KAG9394946.1 tmcB-like protein [Carpediemonas membranifera]
MEAPYSIPPEYGDHIGNYSNTDFDSRSSASGESQLSKSQGSVASSGISSNAGLDFSQQFKNRVFELVYLSTTGTMLMALISLMLTLIEYVQLYTIPLGTNMVAITPFGIDFHHVQRYISYVRLAPAFEDLGPTYLSSIGLLITLVYAAFVAIAVISIRAIQSSQVPNMLFVRFIKLVVAVMLAGGYIPIIETYITIAVNNIEEGAVVNYMIAGAAVIMFIAVFCTTFALTLLVFPSVMTAKNPLARMHARVDVVYLVAKTAMVLMPLIPGLDHTEVPAGFIIFLALVTAAAYAFYIPYYAMYANIARSVLIAAMLVPTCFSIHWGATWVGLVAMPLFAGWPFLSLFVTEFPLRKYRLFLRNLRGDSAELTAMLAANYKVPIHRPIQVEIAVRQSIRRIRKLRAIIDSIERRVPMTVMEYTGGISDGGTIDYDVLPQEWRDTLKASHAELSAEVDTVVRLFQFVRSKWRRSSFATMAYIHFVACFKSTNLQSAINGTTDVFNQTLLFVDVQYFAFITQKYSSSLQGDSSVMERLETQRNTTTLLRSQRRLTDALATFWNQVAAQRTQRIGLRRLNGFVSNVQKIQGMMVSTEKLYARMLRDPTPRLLRSYIQYVGLVNRHEIVSEYINALEGQADELEVVRGNEHGDIRRRRKTPKIAMFDLARRSTSFISLHIRALVSVMLIAALFGSSILMVTIALQMCRFISWQLIISSGVATGIQMVGLGYSTLRATGSATTLAAAAQCAGPFWKAMTEDLSEDYIMASLGTYHNFLYVFENNDWSYMSENPYESMEAVSLSFYDEFVNLMIKGSTRVIYDLKGLLATTEVSSATFTDAVLDSEYTTESVYQFVSKTIFTAEAIVYCINERTAAGHADPINACTAELNDHLLGYEYTLGSTVIYQLFRVADSVYQKSQIFPVIELAVFVVIFALFLLMFLFVAGILYIVPMAQDVTFSAHLVQLFASVNPVAIDQLILRYERSRSKRLALKERLSQSNGSMHSRHQSVHLDASDDDIPIDAASHAASQAQYSYTRFEPPLDEVEALEIGSSFDNTPREPGFDGQANGSSDSSDTDSQPRKPIHSPIPGGMRSIVARSPSVSSTGSDQFDPDAEPEVLHPLAQTLSADSPPERQKPKKNSSSLVQMASAVYNTITDDKQQVGAKISQSSIRLTYAMRQLPMLAVWLFAFGLIFVAMTGYALYETGDITQTAGNIFIQYRELLLLAHLNQIAAATTWDSATAPLDTGTMMLWMAFDTGILQELVPYLTGLDTDLLVIDYAWNLEDSTTRTLSEKLLSVLAQDQWMLGYNEATLDLALHSLECLRVHETACTATRSPETQQGLLALAQAYLSYADIALEEVAAGTMYGPGQAFLNETAVLDMSGGMYQLQFSMRNRFVTQINNTQTNIILFFAVFVVLLGVFYFLYFFRTIIRMTKTRRQFDLLFQSMPRNDLGPKILEKFLEFFPDDEEIQ